MAKQVAVWGIDIGRCALKALRCKLDGNAVVAEGFDYIEYPKLLTQPEADAPQLVKEALEQFLSRNTVRGDRVAISVSGESGLARYFKPPPVDVKKIADIVKYEARQQIPFALEDVIWDYQRMPGGQEVDGFALDTEIGLFAMKREAVAKAMAPYNTAGIEVDIIQLSPIALYNYVAYDITKELPEGEEYSSESPPPSLVVLSIGTDTTDLVVTNGYRVWQRNIPLGGNHFTKQLSKELKLTFAKAEHLKRNPRQAEDPKAIFQAMRPVFADLVTEVQRSIGFFQSLDRKAKITHIVALGNTVKMPGLVPYLAKHLGYDVQPIESFNKLSGAPVITAPSFKENVLTFGTCYGLCLQALGKSKLQTNLLPPEILTQRLIRAKKPWAIAGVSAMVLACALNYAFWYNTWYDVHPQKAVDGVTWATAIAQAKQADTHSKDLLAKDQEKMAVLEVLRKIGQEVVGSSDRRLLWLELLKAINKALPPMQDGLLPQMPTPDVKTLPFEKRKDLKIEYIETEFFPDLATWFTDTVKEKYLQLNPELAKKPADGAAPPDGGAPLDASAPVDGSAAPAPDMLAGSPDAAAGYMPGGPGGMTGDPNVETGPQTDLSGVQVQGPTGPGWVIEIKGYHYYNDPKDRLNYGPLHVRNTLLKQLKEGYIDLPLGPGQPMHRFSMKDLGIGYAILAYSPRPRPVWIENPNYVPPTGTSGGAGLGETPMAPAFPMGTAGAAPPGGVADPNAKIDPDNPPAFQVYRYDFAVQFVWQEKPLNIRLQEIRQREEAARKAAEEAAAGDSAAGGAAAPAGAPASPAAVAGGAPPPGAAAPAVPAAPPDGAATGVVPPDASSGAGVLPSAGAAGAAPSPVGGPQEPGAGPPGAAPPGSAPPGAAPSAPAVPPVIPEIPDQPM
jgi:type IV pilus assembly protein PilM